MKVTTYAAGALLAACLAATAVPAAAQTLRWGAQNDILSMDPHSQNHATTNAILMHAYEGLTRYGATREVEPALATRWTFTTPTQVRFDLRRNVKWHDGTPFTADDVVFTFKRAAGDGSDMKGYTQAFKTVRKIDDHTVEIETGAP